MLSLGEMLRVRSRIEQRPRANTQVSNLVPDTITITIQEELHVLFIPDDHYHNKVFHLNTEYMVHLVVGWRLPCL